MRLSPKMKLEIARLKRNEAKFNRSTPAQKRVMIAKDVIAQVALGKLIASPGTYVASTKRLEVDEDTPAREAFVAAPACEVCAVGGAIVSGFRLANCASLGDIGADDGRLMASRKAAEKFFPSRQLDTMECAFELCGILCDGSEESGAIRFGDLYPDSDARLVAIMRNIIRNRGTFRPAKLTKAESRSLAKRYRGD